VSVNIINVYVAQNYSIYWCRNTNVFTKVEQEDMAKTDCNDL